MKSTAQRTLVRQPKETGVGSELVDGPPEVHVARRDLGGDPATLNAPDRRVLLRLLQLTDLHVIDAASPARAEWVEARAHDPFWRPLLHLHRPYEALVNAGVAAMAASVGTWSGDPIELAVVTGDCIDNAQANELDAYFSLLDGGSFVLPYAGPLEPAWRAEPAGDGNWPFWRPTDEAPDVWKQRFGFPVVPDLLAAVSAPVRSVGLGMPWFSVVGNHDVMRQGTAFTTPELDAIAVGRWKHAGPANLAITDPLNDFITRPQDFSCGLPRFPIIPSPDRRAITTEEFIRAHRERGRGFPVGTTAGRGDYAVDTEGGVRLVMLDTNHPSGSYQGSVGSSQLEWVDAQLRSAVERPCVIVSHHGYVSLDNTYGSPRLGTPELEAVLHRYGNVVAWVSGHRHRHRVRACPDPTGRTAGFWSITTGSMIDWPCQGRVIEIVADASGCVGVVSTIVDHDALAWEERGDHWLAGLHRDLAERFSRSEPRIDRPGSVLDRNVLLPRRR